MRADPTFAGQAGDFWAQVKLISIEVGYSARGAGSLRRYDLADITNCYARRQLSTDHLVVDGQPTPECLLLLDYLNFRANIIEDAVRPNLMDREEARREFEELHRRMPSPTVDLPMNKQKGEKRHYAYLTCIVNLLTENALRGAAFDDSPGGPVTITFDGRPTRTFSRRMDGVYPSLNNPVACWEIKEYYGTTTFGSRVAGGVYETMLDGLELHELQASTGRNVHHYLIVDDRYTWWDMGRSYLCRMVDMVHSGLVDEVLFGREVLSRWPEIVSSWR